MLSNLIFQRVVLDKSGSDPFFLKKLKGHSIVVPLRELEIKN